MKTIKNMLAMAVMGTLASVSVTAYADSHCLDSNTMTCITEEDININGPAVEYTIENNLQERLLGFGVTNTQMYGNASTYNVGWKSRYISQESWDAGGYNFHFVDISQGGPKTQASVIWRTGVEVAQQPVEVPGIELEPSEASQEGPAIYQLGSFASLFGTEDTHVSFYWNQFTQDNALNANVTLDNFFLDATPNSDFSTFGASGNVVTTSVAAVPEPETYAMLLAGLGLLGFATRKKTS